MCFSGYTASFLLLFLPSHTPCQNTTVKPSTFSFPPTCRCPCLQSKLYVHPTKTLSIQTLSSALPPDPWAYSLPQTSRIVTFQSYKKNLNARDVYTCLLMAANAVIAQSSTGGDALIGAAEMQSQPHHVRLKVRPAKMLTYAMWGATLQALRDVVTFFGTVAMHFDILAWDLMQTVGGGSLFFV